MLKRHKIFCLLSLCPALATANTGTITFNGELTANTCNVDIDGSGANATVTLPTISASGLDSNGKTAGDTRFTISLSGCAGTLKTASSFFESGPHVNTDGRLINAGNAKSVDIQLVDVTNNYQPINIGSTEQINSAGYVEIVEDNALLPYVARYYATGKAEPGTVMSSVTYNIQYK